MAQESKQRIPRAGNRQKHKPPVSLKRSLYGSRRYVEMIVSFVDILGFSVLVESTQSDDSAEELLTELENLLTKVKSGRWPKAVDFSIKLFSDCICTSAPPNYLGFIPTAMTLMSAQRSFMKRHILLRGAVTAGRHYESSNVLFSEGLVRAYKLEQSVALYPRIVVDASLVSRIFGIMPDDENRRILTDLYLLRDSDGQVFLNYFPPVDDAEVNDNRERDLAIQKALIIQGREKYASNPSIMLKLAWLERYHNYIVQLMHPSRKDLLTGSPHTQGFERVTPQPPKPKL